MKQPIPIAKLDIDAMLSADIRDIEMNFEFTEINIAGMDEFFNAAIKEIYGTDNYELRNLFEAGIKLGVFLCRNESLIEKI